jgi:hypothetical protein
MRKRKKKEKRVNKREGNCYEIHHFKKERLVVSYVDGFEGAVAKFNRVKRGKFPISDRMRALGRAA